MAILKDAAEDSYKRLILPLLSRSYRCVSEPARLLSTTGWCHIAFLHVTLLLSCTRPPLSSQEQPDGGCGEGVRIHVRAEPATEAPHVSRPWPGPHGRGPGLPTRLQAGHPFAYQ